TRLPPLEPLPISDRSCDPSEFRRSRTAAKALSAIMEVRAALFDFRTLKNRDLLASNEPAPCGVKLDRKWLAGTKATLSSGRPLKASRSSHYSSICRKAA